MVLTHVVTRQCEYIIKIYSVLIFPLVALLYRSFARSLCVWKDLYNKAIHVLRNYEPPHDKTNKMSVRPAKTQISLDIRPVWSVFAVRSMGS